MTKECPTILRTLVIGDDPKLIAQISCLVAKRGAYLPVLEGPRMLRSDADAEVIRRNNVAARLQPSRIILAGLDDRTCDQFAGCFPASKTQRISSATELREAGTATLRLKEQPLVWGRDNPGLGMLAALRAKRAIAFTDEPSPKVALSVRSHHLVVCEAGDDLAQVIAANYAFALGAEFHVVPKLSDEHADSILAQLYGLYDRTDRSPSEVLEGIRQTLRSHVGCIPLTGVMALTFVTNKVPWGFGYPEVPTTHLFAYPDLGTCIANGLVAEQSGAPGMRVALLIDPGAVDAAEIQAAVKSLRVRSVFIRGFRGPGATVYEVSRALELYPYDLLLVSTHCGDASGWRWTYEYVDSEGYQRTLVVDLAISVAVVPGSEKLEVMQFTRFVSLDGVDWDDPEQKKSLYVGTAIRDYIDRTREPKRLEPARRELIERVVGSSALKMFDGNYIAVPRAIAGYGTPIVLNNACASWHRLAETFVFGNARVYVGTLFSVSDVEAEEVVTRLMERHFGKPLAVALWHAQNEVYGEGARRPYMMVGVHCQRLRATAAHAPALIYKQLIQTRDRLVRDQDGTDPREEDKHRATTDYVRYLEREAQGVRKRWLTPRRKS